MIQNRYPFIKEIAGTILVCLVMVMGACTDKFEEFNTDPNRATDNDIKKDMLALGGMFPPMIMDVIPVSDKGANEYQRAINLTGDIFSGYLAAIGQWNGGVNNNTYDLSFDGWNDVAFAVAYRTMGYWQQIKEKSIEFNSPTAYFLAQILKVMTLHRITDNYGPIPYSKMGQGALGSPYDSQEEVYKGFFKDLDEAINELTGFVITNPGVMPLKKNDLIYEGDYKKWIVFANSLKLRLAMRLAYVEPELARKYAEEAVNNEYGVMVDNSSNAQLKSALGVKVYNPLWVCWSRYNDTRMGASMESFLKGYADPRMGIYFSPSMINNGYHGVSNGILIKNKLIYEPASAPNVSNDTDKSPILWMCAAEIYFLRAEGALRKWKMGDTAENLYRKGIETSLSHRDVKPNVAEVYVKDSTSVPNDYVSELDYIYTEATTDIKIRWKAGDTFERNLEQIITQKWLAMFPDGQEAWTEYRRTGYPQIFPVVTNKSGNIDTKLQIRRIPFPQSEYSANKEEVTKAVTLLGGPDHGGTKLWWDKKSRNK